MINIDHASIGNSESSTTMQNVKVKNLSVPINIEIPITQAKPHDNYECAYYDEERKEWIQLPGGRYDPLRKVMQCETNHLSQFTVLAVRSDERPYLIALISVMDIFLIGSLIASVILDRRS